MNTKKNKIEQLLAGQKDLPFASIADDVIKQIDRTSHTERNGILVNITRLFPKVAAACLIVIFGLLLRTYILEGSLNPDSILGLTELTVEEAFTFYE